RDSAVSSAQWGRAVPSYLQDKCQQAFRTRSLMKIFAHLLAKIDNACMPHLSAERPLRTPDLLREFCGLMLEVLRKAQELSARETSKREAPQSPRAIQSRGYFIYRMKLESTEAVFLVFCLGVFRGRLEMSWPGTLGFSAGVWVTRTSPSAGLRSSACVHPSLPASICFSTYTRESFYDL
ncbi:hypothetical protein P4O66_008941, partial [Electrophorus voltai]